MPKQTPKDNSSLVYGHLKPGDLIGIAVGDKSVLQKLIVVAVSADSTSIVARAGKGEILVEFDQIIPPF